MTNAAEKAILRDAFAQTYKEGYADGLRAGAKVLGMFEGKVLGPRVIQEIRQHFYDAIAQSEVENADTTSVQTEAI